VIKTAKYWLLALFILLLTHWRVELSAQEPAPFDQQIAAENGLRHIRTVATRQRPDASQLSSRKKSRAVKPASHSTVVGDVHETELMSLDPVGSAVVMEGEPILGGGDAWCGDACGTPLLRDWWIQGEYLMWWMRPMDVPALVTSGTADSAGVLGVPGTQTLVGGELLSEMYSGARIRTGIWTDRCAGTAWTAEFFGVGEQTERYSFSGNGDSGGQILSRPFFNVLTTDDSPSGTEDAELVAYPDQLSGTVSVEATSRLYGVGVHHMWTNCQSCDGIPLFTCGDCGPVERGVSTFVGWRYLNLDESLRIDEDLTSLLAAPNDGRFLIYDQFKTQNKFNGADLGVLWKRRRRQLSLDVLMRVAVGVTNQNVSIAGATSIQDSSAGSNDFQNATGGLLAQRTNIGDYSRDKFSMIPELGITLGHDIGPGWRFTVGYSLLFWANVVRPGDQIDRDINPNLLPPETTPLTGLERPAFDFVETDLWLHGLSLGLERAW
jgi:hypothetical protein